ncbi:hypothetical protein M945_2629 [Clostridium saccharobutylicum DSM 13864]|nr:hypothetical protein M945_2629 [Clostridium saccharobutylicum DSM 13864]
MRKYYYLIVGLGLPRGDKFEFSCFLTTTLSLIYSKI